MRSLMASGAVVFALLVPGASQAAEKYPMAGLSTVKTVEELDEFHPKIQQELAALNAWLAEDHLPALKEEPTDGCFSTFGVVMDDGTYAEYQLAKMPEKMSDIEYHLVSSSKCSFDRDAQVDTCKFLSGEGSDATLYYPDPTNRLSFVSLDKPEDAQSLRLNPALAKDKLQVFRSCDGVKDLLLPHITTSHEVSDTDPTLGTLVKGFLTINGLAESVRKHIEKLH